MFDHLYIKIGLSRCVTTGVAWMDGRSRAAGTGGKLRAEIDGSGGGCVAYEARGYKQGWADERAGRRASPRPKSSQNRAMYYLLLMLRIIHCWDTDDCKA